jgi:spore germination protein
VSIDIEGQYAKERAGFVSFVKDFYHDMKTADPTAFILLDTYTDSAANPDNFYNVSELYPFVNDIFIMGYDMNTLSTASPNAPLINENLGNSDVQSLLSYTSVVPPQKLILGVPFYGYDFTTKDPYPYSPTKNSYPVAVTWDSILSVGRPQLWDPMSLTPWYRFKTGKTWHQTWFDNPVSIALKTALANEFHLGGVGVWALGMNGGDTQMLQALAGGRAPYKKQQILEASKATKSKKRKVAKR